jgi:Zn-dependent protease with chaperone function
LVLVGGGGCTTPAAKVESWLRAQGGISTDPDRLARVERVAKWFGPDLHGAPIRIRVLAADTFAAYGWRGGELFVTRGLVDLLDDQELAAALAHEMGHLLADEGERAVTGLSGGDVDADLGVEARADRIGVDLLRRHYLTPRAMPRMLAKVERASGLDASCRDGLRRRIEMLKRVP